MRINGKKINVESIFIVLIILSLALENFMLFRIMDAAIKPIQAVAACAVVYCFLFHAIDVKKVLWAIAFLAIPLCPLYRVNDKTEFLKTYVIYAIIVLFVCFALSPLKKTFCEKPETYLKIFNFVIGVVAVLGIVQFVLMNFAGVMFLENLYGSLQVGAPGVTQESGFYRAFSVFHEPSYFGWVLDIALAINLVMLEKKPSLKRILFIGLIIFSIILTISSAALWIMALILLIYLFSIRKININMVFGAIVALAAVVLIVALVDVSFITNSMSRIYRELTIEGSSGYERLVVPVEYVMKVAQNYPIFGRGLGQSGDIDNIGIVGQHGGTHNSLFSIYGIFGITCIFYWIWITRSFFGTRFNKQFIMKRIMLFASIIGMYASTGAAISFDTFVFVIIILLFVSKYEKLSEDGEEDIKGDQDNIELDVVEVL